MSASSSSSIAGPSQFYISTAINYANGPPHMGHAYEAIIADTVARYHRYFGRDVFFLTGSDEHGLKISDTAAAQNLKPIELTDRNSAFFQSLNKSLCISNDRYIRTTEPQHYEVVQSLWKTSAENGDIYLGKYKGWYNTREEAFMTETEAKLSNYCDPTSGKPLVEMEEESYFFRMTKYLPALINHIKENKNFIQPDSVRSEVLARLEGEEAPRDLSVSRCNFSWGVPVPSNVDHPDRPHVMYVWFDALPNYLTGIDYGTPGAERTRFWPANVHLIGKDIVWFHSVIWPCMLMSIGAALPKQVFCHGFILGPDGRKMSKSIGNVVDPLNILDKYGVDAFRYFLLRETNVGADLVFSERRLVDLFNADLLKSFGNLIHRATSLCKQFCGGQVNTQERVSDLPFDLIEFRDSIDQHYREFSVLSAVELIIAKIHLTNQWMTRLAPWAIKDDPDRRSAIICTLLEAIFVLTHYLQPIVPEGAQRVFAEKFGVSPQQLCTLSPEFKNLPSGTLITVGNVLYQPLEFKLLPIQEIGIHVGKITAVQIHPTADRLYVLKVDFGSFQRQIVAGLVSAYSADQLQDRLVVALTNLKASKLRGQDSEGMLLVAKSIVDGQERVELLQPPAGAPPGTVVQAENASPLAEREIVIKEFKKIVFKVESGRIIVHDLPLVTSSGPITTSQPDGSTIE